MCQSFLSFHQWRCLVFANLDKIPQLKADSSQKRKTLERIPAFPYTSQAQAGTACRGSPEWLGWFSHRSVFSTCLTISAPTTMRAGLLPAPL